jgi:DNA-binding response OmpR family regulator
MVRDGTPEAALLPLRGVLTSSNVYDCSKPGVDYCVPEPSYASELAVRLGLSIRLRQAASEHAAYNTVNVLSCGDLELDPIRRRVARSGSAIDLRPKEVLLLGYLVRDANRPVTRTMTPEQVWRPSLDGLTNLVDVYVSALRNKIDHGFHEKLIRTNRGVGYTLTTGNTPPTGAGRPSASQDTAARDIHILRSRGQNAANPGTRRRRVAFCR